MTRRFWLAALLSAVLFASACAGGEVEGEGAEGEQGGGGRIEVAAVWSGSEKANFQRVLDAFTDKTGIETSFRSTGDDIGAFLGPQIEGGSPPDVAMIPQPGLLRDLVQRGALKEVGQKAEQALEQNYDPIWKELGSVDGKLYGIYFKVSNKSTWWYNTQAFQQAGVEAPRTWPEMLQAAKTVDASGVPWLSIGAADGWPLTDMFENVYLRTGGAEKYDQLSNHEIKWTDPSVINALNVLAQLFGEPGNLAGGTRGALQTTFDESVPQVFTQPPKAATVYEGDFVAGIITAQTKARPEQNFNYFDFPAIEGSEPSVVSSGDAAVALTNNQGAQSFLEFLATPEAAEAWASEGGFLSPNKQLDPSVYPDEITRRIATSLVEAQTVRYDLSDLQPAEFGATTGQGLWKLFQDFLRNPQDARGIAQQMERAASQAHGS